MTNKTPVIVHSMKELKELPADAVARFNNWTISEADDKGFRKIKVEDRKS